MPVACFGFSLELLSALRCVAKRFTCTSGLLVRVLTAVSFAFVFVSVTRADAQTQPSKIRVASSGTHTLVLAPDGTVLCQGRNQYSICGVTTPEYTARLTPVPGVPKARAVAVADAWTSMVLGDDGVVYVWGQNNFGLFGGTDRGPTYVRTVPTAIAALSKVIDIAATIKSGAALREDGTVWMWGEDVEGLLGTGTLTKSWENGKPQYTPTRVAGLDGVVQIANGSNYMLALKSDGTVWGWGANKYAQLGLGDNEARARPTKIPTLSGVTRILAEGHMSAARMADGSWMVWGGAPSAKPPTDDGPPVLTPSPLPGLLRDAVDLSNGAAAFRDGTVRTWGGNSFGTLGTGGTVDAFAVPSRAVLVRSLSSVVQVWSGNNRSLALKSDGTLLMWGPSGSEAAGVYRVPMVMATFKLEPPR